MEDDVVLRSESILWLHEGHMRLVDVEAFLQVSELQSELLQLEVQRIAGLCWAVLCWAVLCLAQALLRLLLCLLWWLAVCLAV